MNIYKSLEVGGSTFSFVPEKKPAVPQESLQNIGTNSLPSIESQLLELAPSDRKRLLSQVFVSEFEELKNVSRNEGFTSGKLDAENLVQEAFKHQTEELTASIDSWKEMMLNKDKEIICKIDQEDDFRSLLFQATNKLLLKELTDKDYIQTVVLDLVNEFSSRKVKTLIVSELHYTHLKGSESVSPFSDVFDLQPDPKLLPGSFRLQFEQGFVEYDLDAVLVDFKNQLSHSFDPVHETNERS